MSEHKPGEPFCDCENCRAMTPYQIRGAWQTDKEVGLEWMRRAKELEAVVAMKKTVLGDKP